MYRSSPWIHRAQGLLMAVARGGPAIRQLAAELSGRVRPGQDAAALLAGAGDRRHLLLAPDRPCGAGGSRCRPRRASRHSAMPCGWLNLASAKSPSAAPICAAADRLDAACRRASATTMRLWLLSAMNSRLPASSASTLPGNRSGVSAALSASRSNRSGVSSSMPLLADSRASHVSMNAVECLELDLAAAAQHRRCPSGSISTSVGQLWTP